MANIQPEIVLSTVRTMMKRSEYCFIITHGEHGELNARLMQPYDPDSDFTIYFGAGPSSRKVREIAKNNKVTVALMNPHNAGYATMVGTASIQNDPALKSKYWRAHWSDMFPGGPNADDYILIKFVPERIEVLDFTEQLQPQPYWSKPTGLKKDGGHWQVMESPDEL